MATVRERGWDLLRLTLSVLSGSNEVDAVIFDRGIHRVRRWSIDKISCDLYNSQVVFCVKFT